MASLNAVRDVGNCIQVSKQAENHSHTYFIIITVVFLQLLLSCRAWGVFSPYLFSVLSSEVHAARYPSLVMGACIRIQPDDVIGFFIWNL